MKIYLHSKETDKQDLINNSDGFAQKLLTNYGLSLSEKDGDIVAKGSEPEASGDPSQSRLLRGENVEATHVLQQEAGRTLNVKSFSSFFSTGRLNFATANNSSFAS